jgi:hypothetical protein
LIDEQDVSIFPQLSELCGCIACIADRIFTGPTHHQDKRIAGGVTRKGGQYGEMDRQSPAMGMIFQDLRRSATCRCGQPGQVAR